MNMKRILSAALVLAMLVGLVPGAGVTAEATGDTEATKTITQTNTTADMTVRLTVPAKSAVDYLNWNGTELVPAQTGTDYLYVTSDMTAWGQEAEVGDPAITTWYVVDKNVTIDTVTVTGDVHLILCDGATLTASNIGEGQGTNALTIYGQSEGTGKLITTTNASGVAAIGAMSILLTVNGGAVEATSENGPAIMAGSFTVNGGTVTAIGNPATYNATAGSGMTILAGDDEESATVVTSVTSADSKKWVSIAPPKAEISYMAWNAETSQLVAATTSDYVVVKPTTQFKADKFYVVSGNVTLANRVTVTGEVHLILCDGATLNASKGITVTGSNSLTIYGQTNGTGALTATGGAHGAGIGSAGTGNGGAGTAGSVTINGGTVTANGGVWSAGIGGGNGGTGGNVTINGGTVTATGGTSGAGIGGGSSGNGGNVTINGGTVTATGYGDKNNGGGAGIGGGNYGNGGTVKITGGVVNATGSKNGAGIGGGSGSEAEPFSSKPATGNGGTVEISGGVVNAQGSEGGAGIGGGNYGAGGTVTITGGTVTANGGSNAAGIGRGNRGSNGSLTIGTGMQVKAGAAATETIIENATFTENYTTYKWVCIGIFHTHNFGTSYALSTTNAANDTITAECTADLEHCTLGADHVATLTIAPTEDGTATLTGGADFGVSDTNIVYTKNGESTTAQAIKEAQDAAFYQASITVGGQTAYVTYGVNQIALDKTYTNESDHGTIPDDNVPSVATIGATVRIPTTPADGYQLKGITAPGANDVSKDGNTGTFTMPNSAVTVSAEFEPRDVGVTLAVAEGAPETCTAALLTTEYNAAEAGFTRTLGEKFILRVDSDETYSFQITGSTDFNVTALSSSDKKAYVSTHEDADENTQLFEITMPAVPSGDLTVTVTFLEIKNYTVLYQPGETTNTVWCKIGSGEKSFQLKMNPDAQMGDVATFALNVSMTSVPQKIAFGVSELADNATMTEVSVKASAAAAGTWQQVGSDKFLVIGGSARTLIAAFTPNNTPYAVDAADVKSLPDGTQYQIAVCGVGQAGTVKAPAAPTAPTGKDFAGWGYRSEPANGEDTYNAGADISITDDAIFGAVWTPKTSTVTIDLKGGKTQNEATNATLSDVPYNQAIKEALQNLLPTKNGFALDGWTVNKSVTEGGKFFSRGSDFDPNTNITSDLGLNAKWKHVHSYTCVPLSYFGDALAAYSNYAPHIHVRFCGCGDVKLEAHTFRNGVCTDCGYEKPDSTEATLQVSYWKDGVQWMSEVPRTGLKKNEEVTVSAFWKIGDYQFSKWQYRFNNGDSWKDLAADTMVGFLIPRSMQVRALYTEVQVKPQVSLSASKYVTAEQGYNWDTVLFQMEYKLPKDCTYVDAGIRMGDNQGISFYSLKKRKVSAFETAFNFITSDPISFAVDQLTSDPDYIIEKREDNVLGTMSAATLAKYMMENKPINIPEYEPIYWQANPATKGRSGSVNTLTPLRFIQKNNGNHYIYGVAYLRFKDSTGEHTIYTEAIPVTRDTIPEKNTVTATYNTSN